MAGNLKKKSLAGKELKLKHFNLLSTFLYVLNPIIVLNCNYFPNDSFPDSNIVWNPSVPDLGQHYVDVWACSTKTIRIPFNVST